MRLSKFEQDTIKRYFQDTFNNAKLYLFGSRVDDTKKGGDIDLYIEINSHDYNYSKLLAFNASVQDKIGEQKIDIVVNQIDKNIQKPIYENAKKYGVLLG